MIRDVVPLLPLPTAALLSKAQEGDATMDRHDAFAALVPALRLVETRQPERLHVRRPERLRIATWNVERCARVEAAANLLQRAEVDVALLSEMDLGMARSGNRHTAQDLATVMDASYVFGAEFVELGLGVGRELTAFAGHVNVGALHGNAIVSALPLRDPFLIRLDEGGAWFVLDWHHRRLGGRVAVGVTVDLARGPVLAVSVHLENRSTPAERRVAIERLLSALPSGIPAVVAGDLNTSALQEPEAEPDLGWFERPDLREPLFDAMREGGFDWLKCNTPEQTRRRILDGRPAPRPLRVDWIFTRDLDARAPRTWAATDDDRKALSDHEMITVEVG